MPLCVHFPRAASSASAGDVPVSGRGAVTVLLASSRLRPRRGAVLGHRGVDPRLVQGRAREGKEPLDCCGKRDCAPYPHRSSAGELAYEVQIKGKWYAIDPESVVGEFSPDGQVHVCCLDGCETMRTHKSGA